MNILKKVLVLGALINALVVGAVQAEVAIVVNPANNSEISAEDVKRIFLGKEDYFSNGNPVKPVGQQDANPVVAEFNEKVLERTSSQLKAYYSKLIFTGRGTQPEQLANDSEVLRQVASGENVIGFVDSASVNDSVKVVLKL